MYAKILQRLLQNFFVTMGRAPVSAAEWAKLRRQAMEFAKKEGGDPITGALRTREPKSLMDTTKDLPSTGILQKRGNIIPFPKQKSRTMTPMSGKVEDVYFDHPQDPRLYKPGLQGLMKKGDVTVGTAPKTLKPGKQGEINKEKWIAQKKQENKSAIQRFKEKFLKNKPEEPDKFQQGGIAPLVGEPSYAADFYDDRMPMEEGGMTQEDFNQFLKEREEGRREGGKHQLQKDWERYKRFKKYGPGSIREAAQGGRIGLAGGGALFKFIEKLFIKASNDIRLGRGKWKGLDQKQMVIQHDNLTKKVTEFQKTGNTEGLEVYFGVNPNEAFAAASQKASRLGKKGPHWKEQEVQAQQYADEAEAEAWDKGRETVDSLTGGIDERTALKQKYPGITDDLVEKILVDDNPQRKADVMGTIDDYMKLKELGKSEAEAYDIITKSFSKTPTKHAQGGRADFIFGGSAGLRALLKRLKGGRERIFPSPPQGIKKFMSQADTDYIDDLKLQQLETILRAAKIDKESLAHSFKVKKMNDPGLDFLMGKLDEAGLKAKNLDKYTDIDKDIMDVEMMIKNYSEKKLKRKPNAEGGITRAGFPFGGKALKAIRDAWRANKTWGVGGPPYKPEATSFNIREMTKRNLGTELSLNDLRNLESSPFRGPKDKSISFDIFNQKFKNNKARILKEKLEESKIHAEAMISSAKQVPAEDATAKKIQAQFTREGKKQLEEAKEGLKEIDIYMGMLQKKGRSVHAEGGRIGYSGGGQAGLPAVTMGTPQMNMQQPQMPAGPQPAGIPGGTIVAQNQMQQAPWMGPQMQQGIGGMQRPQPGGMPRPMAAQGGRIGFGLGGIDKGRRAFMKLLAALGIGTATIGTGLLKIVKGSKGITTIKAGDHIIQGTKGMPDWFIPLVNRITKEGDDVTKKLGTVEREMVHTKSISKTEDITVYRNLDTGNVRVEYGSPEFDKTGKVIRASNDPDVIHLEYRAPEVIDEGKHMGKKTDPEFSAAESEPEVVNWDGDIEMSGINEVNTVDDLVTPTHKLKEFGKKNLTHRDKVIAKKKQKYKNKLETDQMEQVDYIEKKHGPFPDPSDYGGGKDTMIEVFEKYRGKASGGLAYALGE